MPPPGHEQPDDLSEPVAARLASLRESLASATGGEREAALRDAVRWLTESAPADERDAALRALLIAHAEGGVQRGAPGGAEAPASPAPGGGVRHDDLLHDTWSQLGGTSEDVDVERLAGVARAACFAFLMDIDEFAANLYGQLNLDRALLEGSLRERIAEYLNMQGEPDPEALLRLIQRRRTAVLYLLHLAGTAGWVFWQDIIRDRLAPERLASDAVPARNGKAGKSTPELRAWEAYRERYEGLNQKEQLEALWLETARGQLARLFGHKDGAGV